MEQIENLSLRADTHDYPRARKPSEAQPGSGRVVFPTQESEEEAERPPSLGAKLLRAAGLSLSPRG